MKVMQVGRYSLIMTVKRSGLSWLGSARIKPSSPAPLPFSEFGTYQSKAASWTPGLAYAALQKDVVGALRESSERPPDVEEEALG